MLWACLTAPRRTLPLRLGEVVRAALPHWQLWPRRGLVPSKRADGGGFPVPELHDAPEAGAEPGRRDRHLHQPGGKGSRRQVPPDCPRESWGGASLLGSCWLVLRDAFRTDRKGVATLPSESFGLRRQEVSGSFSSLLCVLGSVTQMHVPWKGFELFVGSWRATGPLWPSEESPSPLGTRAHGRGEVMPCEEAHPDAASRAGRGRRKAPEATRGWASSRSARQVWRLLPTSRGPLRARGAGAGLPGEAEPDSGALVLCVPYPESVLSRVFTSTNGHGQSGSRTGGCGEPWTAACQLSSRSEMGWTWDKRVPMERVCPGAPDQGRAPHAAVHSRRVTRLLGSHRPQGRLGPILALGPVPVWQPRVRTGRAGPFMCPA